MDAADDAPKEIVKRFAAHATLMPGLSEAEIAAVEGAIGVGLPGEVKDLLRYAAGFQLPSRGRVDFSGVHPAVELEGAFTQPLALRADGCGNFWVVDVNPHTGEWGAIFFVCHDPPVVAIQAPQLGAFLLQVLTPAIGGSPDPLTYIQRQAVFKIWKRDPWLIPVPDVRISGDPLVSKFAAQLPESFHLADLRSREVGSGFSWGAAGPNADVRRAGVDLLFAVERKSPGLLKRMLRLKQ